MQYIIPTNAFGFFFFEVRLHIFSFYMLFTSSANRSDRLCSSLRETREKRTPQTSKRKPHKKITKKVFNTYVDKIYNKLIINILRYGKSGLKVGDKQVENRP